MRIALLAPLVTPICEPQRGGSQSVVADLAQGLTRRGHDVDVYAASGSFIDGVNVIDTGVRSEDLAGALVRPRHQRPGRASLTRDAYAAAWSMVVRQSYELVHAHAFDPPAVEAGEPASCPVLHTLHLPPDEEMAFALAEARRWARPPVVACVSRPQALAWSELVRVDVVLSNGVSVDDIPLGRGGPRAMFAGRLSPEKGAADAVAIASRAGVGIDVIGDAYDPDYARDLDVPVEPALPRPELWRRLGAARAVLCPVGWEEPFGLVAAEAQAAGTPVVAYARGGLVEVVADGISGRLVAPGDIDAAAEALRTIGGLDRSTCRAHAQANLNLEDTLDAHEELYEGVLFEADTLSRPRETS